MTKQSGSFLGDTILERWLKRSWEISPSLRATEQVFSHQFTRVNCHVIFSWLSGWRGFECFLNTNSRALSIKISAIFSATSPVRWKRTVSKTRSNVQCSIGTARLFFFPERKLQHGRRVNIVSSKPTCVIYMWCGDWLFVVWGRFVSKVFTSRSSWSPAWSYSARRVWLRDSLLLEPSLFRSSILKPDLNDSHV